MKKKNYILLAVGAVVAYLAYIFLLKGNSTSITGTSTMTRAEAELAWKTGEISMEEFMIIMGD